MKLLSKSLLKNIRSAVARTCPRLIRKQGGFALEHMEGRTLLSGGLNPSFGDGGLALADFAAGSDSAYGMTTHDGKIYLAGRVWNGSSSDFGVARFNSDGSLDTTFGGGDGLVNVDMGSTTDVAYGIAVDGVGRIVVVGQTEGATGYDFGVMRLLSDGSLDSSFSEDGMDVVDFGEGYDLARSVAIHSDNSIYVLGTASVNFSFNVGMLKYDHDGVLMDSFGSGGKVAMHFDEGDEFAYPKESEGFGLLLHNGKLLVSGYAYDIDFGTADGAIASFNLDGSLNTSFGLGGVTIHNLGGDDDTIRALAVDGSGNIYGVGNGNGDYKISKYSSSGAVVTSFGLGGVVTVDWASGFDIANAVAVNGDKLVVVGAADINGDMDFGLVQMNLDGSMDSDFGLNGRLSLHLGSWDDEAMGVVVDGDGNLLIGGFMVNGSGNHDFVVVHYGSFEQGNQAPVANSGNNYSVGEGGSVMLDGSLSFDPDGTIVSYEWDFDYDGVDFNADVLGMTSSFSALGLDGPTIRTVALRVTDEMGLTHISTADVFITNRFPAVNLGEDRSGVEGSEVTINPSVSDAGDDMLTYAWSVSASNGQVIANSSDSSFSFTPVDQGVYTVLLIVTDDDGGQMSDTMVVTVSNVGPMVGIGGNMTVGEGTPVTIGGSFSDPGADTLSHVWSVVASNGQVIASHSGSVMSFTPVDNGVYTVTLTVSDEDGGTTSQSTVVTVTNVAPTVNVGSDMTVLEGSLVSFTGTYSDVGADTHSLVWSVLASNGQVISNGSGSSFSFTVLDNGIYTVTFKVTDDDGGMGMDSLTVHVNNANPNAALHGPNKTVRGQAQNYSGTFSDAGPVDTHQVRWDFGDGDVIAWHSTNDAGAMNVNKSWKKKGNYSVTMSIRDKDGAVSTSTQLVEVANTDHGGGKKNEVVTTEVLTVGGDLDTMMLFFQPAMRTTSGGMGVLVGVDGEMQGMFNALKKIIAYDDDGMTRREITMGQGNAGKVLSNVADRLLDRAAARFFRR